VENAGEDAQQRRLARSDAADDGDAFARPELELGNIQPFTCAGVDEADIIDLDRPGQTARAQ
jgi:hypothetical protein